jgi:hypothetical protein
VELHHRRLIDDPAYLAECRSECQAHDFSKNVVVAGKLVHDTDRECCRIQDWETTRRLLNPEQFLDSTPDEFGRWARALKAGKISQEEHDARFSMTRAERDAWWDKHLPPRIRLSAARHNARHHEGDPLIEHPEIAPCTICDARRQHGAPRI